MSEQAETSAATAAPDETARYAPLLATGERVLLVRRRHWFTFVNAARWFLLVFGAAIIVEIVNGSVPNGGVSGHVSDGLTWILVCSSRSPGSAGSTWRGSGSVISSPLAG